MKTNLLKSWRKEYNVNKVQKKKMKTVVMHQHHDKQGRVFGALHPVNAEHKKVSTQKWHDYTVNEPM